MVFPGGLVLCFFYYPLHQEQKKLALKMNQFHDQEGLLKKTALLRLRLEQQSKANKIRLEKSYFGLKNKSLSIRSLVRILNKDGGVRIRLRPEGRKDSRAYTKEVYTVFVKGKFDKICDLFGRLSKHDQLIHLTYVELKRGKRRNIEGTARFTLVKKILI